MRISSIVAGVFAAIVALTFFRGSWYQIDQGERGVLLRNGKTTGLAEPGLGFKAPIIDDVKKVSVKTNTYVFDKMNSYSFDQQPADMKISVTLHADAGKVGELYARFGTIDSYVNQRVSPHVHQQVKVVFGQYTAVSAIQKRARLNTDIKDAISSAIGDDGMVVIESVQVENIEFSHAYLASIEQRMLAEVKVQEVQQNAEREKVTAQIAVIQANARADRQLAEATANAKAIRLKGDAEASAIEARAKALGSNPNLVALTTAEAWDGKLPTTMVPAAGVPLLQLK